MVGFGYLSKAQFIWTHVSRHSSTCPQLWQAQSYRIGKELNLKFHILLVSIKVCGKSLIHVLAVEIKCLSIYCYERNTF